MRRIIILIAVIILSSCSNKYHKNFDKLKLSGSSYKITQIANLQDQNYINKIDQFFDNRDSGTFVGADNVKIAYSSFLQDNEKAAILISTGRTESFIKYKEVVFDLYQNGYSVYIHDHRGQGFSGRLSDDRELGYIDNYENYVDDMKTFYDSIVVPHNHKRVYLLAHSLGGAIGLSYLEKYSSDFLKAVIISPLWGLPKGGCAASKMLIDNRPRYAVTQKTYDKSFIDFDKNVLTGSKVRYLRANGVYKANPTAKLGGTSPRWVKELCGQFGNLKINLSNVKTPFILFSGENETVVSVEAHHNFYERLLDLNVDVKAYSVPGAKHEMLFESDSIRTPVIATILDYYE